MSFSSLFWLYKLQLFSLVDSYYSYSIIFSSRQLKSSERTNYALVLSMAFCIFSAIPTLDLHNTGGHYTGPLKENDNSALCPVLDV